MPGIQFTRFASADAFGAGALGGVMVDGGGLVLAQGEVSGTWVSPAVKPGFGFNRLVASWNADTPGTSRLRVEAQVSTASGETSDWYVLGIWAADDRALPRTSVTGQADKLGRIDTDTLNAKSDSFTSYSLRARLERATGDDPSPKLRLLGAAVSDFAYSAAAESSLPLSSDSVELSVPALSQEVHARQYPQWGGGGEAWCSPTSTEMVIEFWGRGPAADDLAWVDPGYADPSVDYAARSTYDAAYRGTGNWPFNTAYAARFGLDAFVTQLRSLARSRTIRARRHSTGGVDRFAPRRVGRLRVRRRHQWPPRGHRRLRCLRQPHRQRSGRLDKRERPPRLRSDSVRACLAARFSRHGLRHPPSRRPAATNATRRYCELVDAPV